MWNIRKIVKKGDYLYAVVPEHPNRTKNNYVLLHRVIMENSINRILNDNEIVHHIDENKKNNLITNLEIKDKKQHIKDHRTIGRIYVKIKCPVCDKIFIKEKRNTHLKLKNKKWTVCSRSCNGLLSRKNQLNLIDNNILNKINSSIIEELTMFL